ncbi:MAG: zinc ABC transporter substrate-binding protein [Acholeplasma sp.]|jgi:zinc transport system substrate-binding protein|nr:MAG: zinc ABC transporter substrate-binding protein [Acholeplasma sp.]
MKKFALLLLSFLATLGLASCTNDVRADIVTTMFTQYDFSRQIVGDKMTVSMIIPPGAEIHNYEATSKDIVAINEAKLFIFTSLEIDQWIGDPSSLGGDDTIVMNLSEHYTLDEHEHEHETLALTLIEDEHEHENEIHYWVDPVVAMQLIDAILENIILVDPANESFYTENARLYKEEIHELHLSFDLWMQDGHVDQEIFFAGHNAMGLFGERYHLVITSLFESFKPDADLTSSELISFTEAVKTAGVHYLFIEELVEPKAANQIKDELLRENYDLTLLPLHAYHNLTKDEFEEGITYVDLFLRNIEFIQTAIGDGN